MMTPTRKNAVMFWSPRLLALALIAWLVYEWMAGSSGLSMSEGHRAIPAWEMLKNGNWLSPTMFEQPYLRKPPGMPWAIAAFSSVMGETELAARSVSAVSMLLAAWVSAWYASRWFGKGAAFWAGAAHLLTPWFWESGRAAEIEALHNLGIVCAAWGAADTLAMGTKRSRVSLLLFGAGVLIAGLAKGPAGVLIMVALAASAWIVKPGGGWKHARAAAAQLGVVAIAAGTVLGGLGIVIWQRTHAGPIEPITQSVTEFLWSVGRIGKIVQMPFVVLASALPLSLAAAWALMKRSHTEGAGPAGGSDAGRMLAVAFFAGIALFAIAGVSNPRYLLGLAALLSPLAGWAVQETTPAVWMKAGRVQPRIAAWATMGILMTGSIVYTIASEAQRRTSSGQGAGTRLAREFGSGSVIIADDLVEARPEVLWYLAQRAKQEGREVRVIWTPASRYGEGKHAWPTGVNGALLRSDEKSDELARLKSAMAALGLRHNGISDRAGPENRPFKFDAYTRPRQPGSK